MSTDTLSPYRQSLFGPGDDLYARCLKAASITGLVIVAVLLVVPKRPLAVLHVDELPSRFARLILEPPKAKPLPAADAVRPVADPAGDAGPVEVAPVPAPAIEAPPPAPVARREAPRVDPAAGRAGRERAETMVSGELAGTTRALSSALDGLASSLATVKGDRPTPVRGGRDRAMRGGRTAQELGPVGGGLAGGSGTADLGGSAMTGSRVAVGALSGGGGGGGGAGGAGASSAATSAGGSGGDGTGGAKAGVGAPGVYRSNASLLAVIQKYAPGIHYCYTNELKHDPTLSGKLVFALVVSAAGEVTEVTLVENGVRSPRLASCALTQIREWRFPPVPRGSTSFQAPFVFTPPR